MKCPGCGFQKMRVTRTFGRRQVVWRELRCPNCGQNIITREAAEKVSTVYRSEFSRYRQERWKH